MSSARFPGKTLEPLLGVPLIVFMAKRVQRAKRIRDLVVATSTDASDDALEHVVRQHGLKCFRGNLQDVLDRFYQAASGLSPANVVRLTGDCPLMDAQLVDSVVAAVEDQGVQYASNVDPPSFPDGLDVECFTFAALERAWRDGRTPSQREHVTPFIRENHQLFTTRNVLGFPNMSHLRWTVDYPDDLMMVRALLERAGARSPTDFDRFDLYRAVEAEPALVDMNRHARNEGYAKSLALERERKVE
jgi:spore coat polysaccharide biosynthesis protein SpsF